MISLLDPRGSGLLATPLFNSLLQPVLGSAESLVPVPNLWPVVLSTIPAVLACVLLHWGALEGIIRTLRRWSLGVTVVLPLVVLVLLIVHVVEITVFAVAMHLLYAAHAGNIGMLEGAIRPAFFDLWYYSACVYTTVGFGDIVPTGPIRFMAGLEALTGLLMVTWSASFTFLVMQRAWQERYEMAPIGDPASPAE